MFYLDRIQARLFTIWTALVHLLFGARPEAGKLGPYVLGPKIGQGGMGEVYRARHELLDRDVAVKLLPRDASPADRARFEREARLTARLAHPNTISVFDFGQAPDGRLYYVMELLDGVTLSTLVEREGAQPASRVVHILKQLCASLGEAHAAGLVHRDIKPENVLLCRQGGIDDHTKLLDFGLVQESSRAKQSSTCVVGTPLYLAPEAIASPESVGPKSDLYAVGAVAYYLLTGRHVFDGRTVIEVCSKHLHVEPEAPRSIEPSIPSELEAIVLGCLAKDPAERPASAAELAERLQECATETSRPSAPCLSRAWAPTLPAVYRACA
jgi:serine/threonine-protein kinase